MKQVLIIDESPLFREYLRLKLVDNLIDVIIGVNAMDGLTKMKNLLPDLVIMDANLSQYGYLEVLKEKKAGPNTVNIPVIIMTQRMDHKRIIELASYNVKKVFTKPVKIDVLFSTLSELLGLPIDIDNSSGIVEVHVNDNIIFIEIAQGLNRDKLDLLRFKMIELIDLYEIRIPKVIVMLSDVRLASSDIINLEKLLYIITKAAKIRPRNVKFLTNDKFARSYIQSQRDYSEIEVASNLQDALDGFLEQLDNRMNFGEKKADIIGDMILSADAVTEESEAMALKFNTDSPRLTRDIMKESLQNLRIAVIDDDFIIQELIKFTFQETGAQVTTFSNGEEFIAVVDTEDFDLAFLDLVMPIKDGFDVLRILRTRVIKYPIIVLSAVSQRDTIIKAYNMGIKSYLIKPLKPNDIFKKSMEILKPSF